MLKWVGQTTAVQWRETHSQLSIGVSNMLVIGLDVEYITWIDIHNLCSRNLSSEGVKQVNIKLIAIHSANTITDTILGIVMN